MNEQMIYLDYQSTTPVDPKVLDAMLPFFTERFGNPHSRSHAYGWDAEQAVEQAREHIAHLIGAEPSEIIFTSGATESNNLALKGVASFYQEQKNHIITVQTEHKCVLNACRHLEQQGFRVTYLPVNRDGLLDLEQLKQAITSRTCLVSVMAVNNEIGVIQPLAEIGAICRQHGVFFHTDAAQAYGKVPLDVRSMQIDLLSVSGHKIYGPKGVGALFVSKRPRVRLEALISGGGQERGMRSGTLPTPLIVGMGKAAELCAQEMLSEEPSRLRALRDLIITEMSALPHVYLNGHPTQRIPGNANLSFSCIEGESMIGAIKNLAVSSGSACTSESLEPSYVLKALGVDEELAHTSIRIGLGRFTTEEEVKAAISSMKNAVARLRDLSPLWEMVQQGINLKSINWSAH